MSINSLNSPEDDGGPDLLLLFMTRFLFFHPSCEADQ